MNGFTDDEEDDDDEEEEEEDDAEEEEEEEGGGGGGRVAFVLGLSKDNETWLARCTNRPIAFHLMPSSLI